MCKQGAFLQIDEQFFTALQIEQGQIVFDNFSIRDFCLDQFVNDPSLFNVAVCK